jgi:hypothetical protein
MHSNISSVFYVTLVPAGIFFFIAMLLRLTKGRLAKGFFNAGLFFILILVIFLVGHFGSLKMETKKRTGTYQVLYQEKIGGSCSGFDFKGLQLTLKKNGKYAFNYKPCFATDSNGKWEWTDNMVHSYSRFDEINDSLRLYFPSENNVDTIALSHYGNRYLTFVRSNKLPRWASAENKSKDEYLNQ